MDFNLSDLQRMLLDSAERFIGDHYSLEHRRELRAVKDGLDAEAWSTFAELGWLSILVPEELGGLGGSMADVAVLASALGSRCVTEPFVSSAVIGATILAGADTPPADLIEGIVAGTVRIALAHDEGAERYDYRGVRSTTVTDGSNGPVVDGRKMIVADAPSATHFIVTAQGPGGPSLALVAADADGIDQDSYALYDGTRASDIAFHKAQGIAILSSGDGALALLDRALDNARLAYGAQGIGSMESDLNICSDYLKERQQFGQPIGQFQALQHIMADMFVATHQARSALFFALANIDGPVADRVRAVSLARINIAEAMQLVGRQAIQLHGGYGVTDEYEVSHHYRYQLVIEKLYGDIDYHTRRLAAH